MRGSRTSKALLYIHIRVSHMTHTTTHREFSTHTGMGRPRSILADATPATAALLLDELSVAPRLPGAVRRGRHHVFDDAVRVLQQRYLSATRSRMSATACGRERNGE
jgi:hypothetical protein